MTHALTSLAGAFVAAAVAVARSRSLGYLLAPGALAVGVALAGLWNRAATLGYQVRGGAPGYISDDSSDSGSSDSIIDYDIKQSKARAPDAVPAGDTEEARHLVAIDRRIEAWMHQAEGRIRARARARDDEKHMRQREADELTIIQFERRTFEPSTVGAMLHDLHTAMVTFSSERRQVTQSYNLSAAIGLAVERVLRPTVATYRDTLVRSRLLISGDDDAEGLGALADVLRDFSRLAVLWGYDYRGARHARYEQRMHANLENYGCAYYVSDVIFRNIARAAAGQGLTPNDGIIDTWGNNKWEAVDFTREPCSFDGAGGRGVRKLFGDFVAEAL